MREKKVGKKVLAIGMVLLMVAVVFAAVPMNVGSDFAGGDGSAGNPYQISTVEQLQDIEDDLDAHYILINDIDASATEDWNSGAGFKPIHGFSGTFNGDGYIITGLFIYLPYKSNIGLFGSINNGVITNVGLENVDITGTFEIGGLAGTNFQSSISNCYTTGIVKGVGQWSETIGGLVGYNLYYSSISNSYSICSVSGNNWEIGGLVGHNRNYGSISNSYAAGIMGGDGSLGGLVGRTSGAGVTTDSYWDIETSTQTYSAGGVGKTTEEMKQQDTFVDWDFDNIWRIKEDVTYPYLWWQILDPEEATEDLIDEIESLELPEGIENSLLSTLENTLKSLEKENTIATVKQLEAFIKQVKAHRGNKLSVAQADELIAAAETIIDTIEE
jgi:hypothetical protein